MQKYREALQEGSVSSETRGYSYVKYLEDQVAFEELALFKKQPRANGEIEARIYYRVDIQIGVIVRFSGRVYMVNGTNYVQSLNETRGTIHSSNDRRLLDKVFDSLDDAKRRFSELAKEMEKYHKLEYMRYSKYATMTSDDIPVYDTLKNST
jgi:hypothetical protein